MIFLRRRAYQLGLLPIEKLAVPVVVVGNISLGGTGKTPFTLWLVTRLKAMGYTPGIISRGYGSNEKAPRPVPEQADPHRYGDEPALLRQRLGKEYPIWVGVQRVAVAKALLAAEPNVDILIADDGLQHYRLHRDMELLMLDQRQFGNKHCLPLGPLREPLNRCRTIDAVIINGQFDTQQLRYESALADKPYYRMQLRPEQQQQTICCYQLHSRQYRPLSSLANANCHAVAGIGAPERFFQMLNDLGVRVTPHPFPDHHHYSQQDFNFGADAIILMTEKDAVKCQKLTLPSAWVLAVHSDIDAADTLLQQLQNKCFKNTLVPGKH